MRLHGFFGLATKPRDGRYAGISASIVLILDAGLACVQKRLAASCVRRTVQTALAVLRRTAQQGLPARALALACRGGAAWILR